MKSEAQRHYLNQVQTAADSTRHNLRWIITRAQTALARLENGQRADVRTVLGQLPADIEHHNARLTALLDLAGMMGVTEDDLLAAFSGQKA